MPLTTRAIQQTLRELGDADIASHSRRFFKTGKGEYGEGDQFLGIRVPVLRRHVNAFRDTPLAEVMLVLKSEYHEERLFALLLLVKKFSMAGPEERKAVYSLYLENTAYINNWDLVDSSAGHIVGAYLEARDKQPIYGLVRSQDLWERRIAIISTFHRIKKHEPFLLEFRYVMVQIS